MKRLVTSESVTSGHPDKVCDQISDRILDEVIKQDRNARVACEVAINNRIMLIMGEITTTANVDYTEIAKSVLEDIGYMDSHDSNNLCDINIIVSLNEQANDIAIGVDEHGGLEHHKGLGAGDQGLMVGYACDETPELMPLAITLAHDLTKRLEKVRKEGIIPYLKPDGKGQVTLAYENNIPSYIDTVVVSSQHEEGVEWKRIYEDIFTHVVKAVIPSDLLREETKVLINPTGRFTVGGPKGDSGLTGRKIIVDTYGGIGRHGGGAFSGKDPSKVDRSGAYMARYIAKNIVASGLARRCEVELAYAIGKANPVAVNINTFGTGKLFDEELSKLIKKNIKLGVTDIITQLDLKKDIYSSTACYGHFGKRCYSWEKTDITKFLAVKYKLWNKSYEEWFEEMTVEKLKEVDDLEILHYVMVRPGHSEQYGFLTPGHLVSGENGTKKYYTLLNRLSEIPSEVVRESISGSYIEYKEIEFC